MRLPDWDDRLNEYLSGVDIATLGDVPCARFAAGAIKAQTGVDYYKPFRGKYKNEIGAAKALKKYGAGTLEATFDSHFEAKPIGFAQRGDIVFDGQAVGICVGADALFVGHEVIEGEHGPVTVIRKGRAEWSKAWGL